MQGLWPLKFKLSFEMLGALAFSKLLLLVALTLLDYQYLCLWCIRILYLYVFYQCIYQDKIRYMISGLECSTVAEHMPHPFYVEGLSQTIPISH
jgi:hypothetical protein